MRGPQAGGAGGEGQGLGGIERTGGEEEGVGGLIPNILKLYCNNKQSSNWS